MSFCSICVRSEFDPSETSLNEILRFNDHYPYYSRNWIVYHFKFFWGAVKTQRTDGSSVSIRVSGGGKLFVTVIGPTQQYILENSLSTTCVGMFSYVKVLCVTTTSYE